MYTVEITSELRARINLESNFDNILAVRKLEGRKHWNKLGGLDFLPSKMNLDILESKFGAYRLINVSLADSYETELNIEDSTYEFKREPYEHQERALEFIKSRKQFALFMEQGTGKTKVVLDYAGILFGANIIDGLLVVAPKGVHRQWVEDGIPNDLNCRYRAMFWNGRLVSAAFRLPNHLYVYCLNYESLNSAKVTILLDHLFTEHKNLLFIMDESHYIKNISTKRWKMCKEIARRCEYRGALTGTPIAKNLEDEWAQLHVVNENIIGIHHQKTFRQHYGIKSNFYQASFTPVDSAYVRRFKEITKPAVFRVTKKELNFKAKQYSKWYFDMTKEQSEIYDKFRREMVIKVEELKNNITSNNQARISANIALTMCQKLQQISNGFLKDDDGDIHYLMPLRKNPRLNAMIEWLNAHPVQCIIWARYRADLTMICEVMRQEGISFVRYSGKESPEQKKKALDLFLGRKRRVLASNPQSGGVGLNLQKGGCNTALYYSNSENSLLRWQSEDRIDRFGMVGFSQFTDLIAHGSRDLPIAYNLQNKKALADYTLDDILKELKQDGPN